MKEREICEGRNGPRWAGVLIRFLDKGVFIHKQQYTNGSDSDLVLIFLQAKFIENSDYLS